MASKFSTFPSTNSTALRASRLIPRQTCTHNWTRFNVGNNETKKCLLFFHFFPLNLCLREKKQIWLIKTRKQDRYDERSFGFDWQKGSVIMLP